MSGRFAIRGGKVVAWADGEHRVLQSATVVFEGNRIVSVGPDDPSAHSSVDASGMLVMPGLLNLHFHGTDTAFTRDFLEESQGARDYTNLYRVLPAVRNAIGARDACVSAKLLFAEALLAGSTTIVEMGYDEEVAGSSDIANANEVAGIAINLGLRCYTAPRYRRGYWRGDESGRVGYYDYPDAGRARMEACVAFCKRVNGSHGDRLRAMLAPGQVDTCDAEMLEETRRVANETGLPIQLHAGQSPTEYRRVDETHGVKTIRHLARTRLLGSDLLIGHGMYLAETSDVDAIPPDELALLATSGTSIVHLPWVKMRQATTMNSYEKFLRVGVNVALGTDTHPVDIVHELHIAAIGCKLAEKNHQATSAAQVFRLATVNGAKALGRDDLGRIAPGCKADLVLLDLQHTRASGYDDPLKYLIYNGDGRDVRTVFVDGEKVVDNSTLVRADLTEIVANMNEAKRRVAVRVAL